MPDLDDYQLTRELLAATERKLRDTLNEMGISQPGPLTQRPPNLFEGWSHLANEAVQFATGYDGSATTMPFTTDVSILTDGSSGDILTGS